MTAISKHRTKNQMIASVLQELIKQPENRTRLMCKVGMSNGEVHNYLTLVTNYGLVERDSVTRTYNITNKGIRLLSLYRRMYELAGNDV